MYIGPAQPQSCGGGNPVDKNTAMYVHTYIHTYIHNTTRLRTHVVQMGLFRSPSPGSKDEKKKKKREKGEDQEEEEEEEEEDK